MQDPSNIGRINTSVNRRVIPWQTVVTVDVFMGRRIGYVGGIEGNLPGNPSAGYVRLVLRNGNNLISAFPTNINYGQ